LPDSLKARKNFWELPIGELNDTEWEMLCDGCGRCCLKKLVDNESGKLFWTSVVCRYFDQETGNCQCYKERTAVVADCVDVKKVLEEMPDWIPPTCAYRLRSQNKPLFNWHPLLQGSSRGMQNLGISIKDKCISEEYVHAYGYHEHVIRWVED
jgi:uncharacterized cysteine cluster protein YcgN (CxxCxxCC family)